MATQFEVKARADSPVVFNGPIAEVSGSELPRAPEDVVHIIGWWQWLVGDVLRFVIPRGLCGESMAVDPDRDAPSELAESYCPGALKSMVEGRSNGCPVIG